MTIKNLKRNIVQKVAKQITNRNYYKRNKERSKRKYYHNCYEKLYDEDYLELIKSEIEEENVYMEEQRKVFRLRGGAPNRRRLPGEQANVRHFRNIAAANLVGIATRCNIDTFDENNIEPYRLGGPDSNGIPTKQCEHCRAFYWDEEVSSAKYTRCCNSGKVISFTNSTIFN